MKQKEMSEEIIIDAFKEGDYPQGKFTGKELAEIQETYNPDNYEAPILIGHLSDPSYKGKSAIPAFGWIGKVKIVGDHLKLVASQFSDELKDFIKKGLYKKVSAAFYDPQDATNPTPGKWHLHHLAFLGGTPPAVKGLEGIQFAAVGNPIEMAEFDASVLVDGNFIDTVEEIGTDDTLNDLTESCATFLSKVTDALKASLDSDTVKSRCQLAASDLSNEIYSTLNMHWAFTDKLENIEEHQESEMSEKKSWLVQLAEKVTNRKDKNVDTKKEQEYQGKITELELKVKEFQDAATAAEAEAKAKAEAEAKAKADAEAAATAETQSTEIKNFCETAIKENRMTPAMRETDEPIMFTLAKTNVDALKSFQEKYSKPIVPLGETTAINTNDAVKPDVMAKAAKYVKDHPAEFKELTPDLAAKRAFWMQANGQIKFE
jgi:hypothetical protein